MHLFAGSGGGILSDLLLGHQPICAVEIDEYCQQVLSARQKDGCIPWFPIFADVTQFDGRPWRGCVDVISGGFPCTDISCAGKGAGIQGEKSGLWREFARIIREVEPRYVFVENSPMLTSRGLGRVLGDLAEMGFDAEWCVLGADDVGAPHRRKRIWILATHPDRIGCERERSGGILDGERTARGDDSDGCGGAVPDAEVHGLQAQRLSGGEKKEEPGSASRGWWATESNLGGMADGLAERMDGPWASEPADVPRVACGVPHRVDRLKAIGNGQVPLTAAMAWRILAERIER